MSKKRTLSGITDYADLLKFAHSSAALGITDAEAVEFYTTAPSEWQQTLVNSCAPSMEAEKAIVLYGDDDVFHLLCVRHGLYPQTIEWAMQEGSPEVAERVVKALKERPSAKAEILMLRRGESELFKLWLQKFYNLEDEAERVLNEDPSLQPLLSLYIDLQL